MNCTCLLKVPSYTSDTHKVNLYSQNASGDIVKGYVLIKLQGCVANRSPDDSQMKRKDYLITSNSVVTIADVTACAIKK
jgi:hypothetical protein